MSARCPPVRLLGLRGCEGREWVGRPEVLPAPTVAARVPLPPLS